MILSGLAETLADLRCPDCGARQAVYTKAGMKSRIRPAHHGEACPGCGATLHMVHAPGGGFREGLGWGTAFVILVGAAMLLSESQILNDAGPVIWVLVALAAAGLYAFAVVATGLILRWTRMMVKP